MRPAVSGKVARPIHVLGQAGIGIVDPETMLAVSQPFTMHDGALICCQRFDHCKPSLLSEPCPDRGSQLRKASALGELRGGWTPQQLARTHFRYSCHPYLQHTAAGIAACRRCHTAYYLRWTASWVRDRVHTYAAPSKIAGGAPRSARFGPAARVHCCPILAHRIEHRVRLPPHQKVSSSSVLSAPEPPAFVGRWDAVVYSTR